MSSLEELRDALKKDPGGLLPDQIMEDLVWHAFDLIGSADHDIATKTSEANGGLAREILGSTRIGPGAWRLWYGGQLQGITRLLRAMLGRNLSLSISALLRSRKYSLQILETLILQDSNMVSLARKMELDDSHLNREFNLLERHELVESSKLGRERWGRITKAGRAALAEVHGQSRHMPPSPIRRPFQRGRFDNLDYSPSELQTMSRQVETLAS